MAIHPCATSVPAARYRSVRLAGAALVLGCLLTFSNARAVEVLTVHELVLHCQVMDEQPEGVDAQYCIRYIQGGNTLSITSMIYNKVIGYLEQVSAQIRSWTFPLCYLF